jgi:hypothetical protein
VYTHRSYGGDGRGLGGGECSYRGRCKEAGAARLLLLLLLLAWSEPG